MVLASFSDRANAERYRSQIALDKLGATPKLTVLSADRADGQEVFRVVAQTSDRTSRDLLAHLRGTGFSDAWHITSPSLTVVPPNTQPQTPSAAQSNSLAQPSIETSASVASGIPEPVVENLQSPRENQLSDVAGPGKQEAKKPHQF